MSDIGSGHGLYASAAIFVLRSYANSFGYPSASPRATRKNVYSSATS